ncbi:hypothetical protein ACIGXM_23425 [Kitasatospora sp. NPDC052896]|uniref:hypothetical protein n=1 Tax=Kitasatospora sp. NPDC052896 TaxID=3364061 RepID=UPI0037C6F784
MPASVTRPATLAVAALLVVLPLSAVSCSATQKAIDCGSTAVRIGGDIGQLGSAYNKADQDPAAAGKAMQNLRNDIDKLNRNASSSDVTNAVDDLQKQADLVQQAIDQNKAPDLGPLSSAAGNLTKVCAG